MIDGDADGLGVVLAESCSLQLLQSEATAGPDLEVVLVGRAVDHRPQLAQGAGGHAGGLGDPGLAPPQLPGAVPIPGLLGLPCENWCRQGLALSASSGGDPAKSYSINLRELRTRSEY